jgi:hypothetical protein
MLALLPKGRVSTIWHDEVADHDSFETVHVICLHCLQMVPLLKAIDESLDKT